MTKRKVPLFLCVGLLFAVCNKEDYLASFRNSTKKKLALIEKNAPMPEFKPVFDRMLVDDSGRLWVELSESRTEEHRTLTPFDVYDKTGRYVYQVWTEFRPGLFRDDKMYRMDTNQETGARKLKRYRVVWSEEQPE